jgi:3-hydroxybutyryl-CoA dehydrogenase
MQVARKDDIMTIDIVAVIGAGTMGAGIALVAARAGHPVVLFDAASAAVERGIAHITGLLDGQVAKGRLSAETRNVLLARITPTTDITALAPAMLVIEAIVEDLDIKATVLRQVEALVSAEVILAFPSYACRKCR